MEKCKDCPADAHPDSIFGLCADCHNRLMQTAMRALFSPSLSDDEDDEVQS